MGLAHWQWQQSTSSYSEYEMHRSSKLLPGNVARVVYGLTAAYITRTTCVIKAASRAAYNIRAAHNVKAGQPHLDAGLIDPSTDQSIHQLQVSQGNRVQPSSALPGLLHMLQPQQACPSPAGAVTLDSHQGSAGHHACHLPWKRLCQIGHQVQASRCTAPHRGAGSTRDAICV